MRLENRGNGSKKEVKISSRVFTYLCLAGLFVAVATGWLMFVKGFFPLRTRTDSASNSFDKTRSRTDSVTKDVPEARFDKLIFVVFDALRSDFITGSSSQVCFQYFHL